MGLIDRQIAKYHEVVMADSYRITSILALNGDKKAIVLGDTKEGFTYQDLLNRIGRIKKLEQKGENLYITPISDMYFYILVDDLNIDKYKQMIEEGYKPCVLIESSPANYQILLKIKKANISKDAANAIVFELNKKFGDPNLSGVVHPHRFPGTANQKSKYKQPNGTYPLVKLLKSENRLCTKTYELALTATKEISKIKKPEIEIQASTIPASNAYTKHYHDIINYLHVTDYSRLDAMIAIRLRATGHSQTEIENAMLENASHTRNKIRNWHDYVRRTAEYAYSYKGDQALAKHQDKIKIWLKIEAS